MERVRRAIGIIFLALGLGSWQGPAVKIDSDLSEEQAFAGKEIPPALKAKIRLISVRYVGLDGHIHQGQIQMHEKVEAEVQQIFQLLYEARFPVQSVIPMTRFAWDDDRSMLANNTSGFNYRTIKGTRMLSKHATGLAFDLNPKLNPLIKRGKTYPTGAVYDTSQAGTLHRNSPVVKQIRARHWVWGGSWRQPFFDYQHFEKNPKWLK